jgi:hypothetical protein
MCSTEQFNDRGFSKGRIGRIVVYFMRTPSSYKKSALITRLKERNDGLHEFKIKMVSSRRSRMREMREYLSRTFESRVHSSHRP